MVPQWAAKVSEHRCAPMGSNPQAADGLPRDRVTASGGVSGGDEDRAGLLKCPSGWDKALPCW